MAGQVSLPPLAKFIKSNKNGRILVDEKNYEYRIKDNFGSTTYWICRKYPKCKAKAKTYVVETQEYIKE